MISLSDLDDREMSNAKSGNWFENHSYRSLANNSAVYNGRPTLGRFMEEWTSLYNSYSGERGILNRDALNAVCDKAGRLVPEGVKLGTNPCSEIILRPMQFCNLSTIVVKAEDTLNQITEKIHMATILGTVQSKMAYFPYLRQEWKQNSEDERLLGVSMTGIFDNLFMTGAVSPTDLIDFLQELRALTVTVNKEWAEKIGINPSTATTCVKPEGTTSCLAGSSSGLHPQHSSYYIRRVRIDKKDPLYRMMEDQGILVEDCVMNPASTAIFSFPMKAADGARTAETLDAYTHLILWRIYAEYYCNHKPSVTISYKDNEFMILGASVYDQFDSISGVSFLPKSEHTYEQAPFEAITLEQYISFPRTVIDFSQLHLYEFEDTTTSSHTMACTAGGCELK
jgi:ribonucleoside-diphosphate reductase alpha chain